MENVKQSGKWAPEVIRAFPEGCKWFQRGDTQALSEVEGRSRRLQERGVSPCEECPLCPQGHSH